MSNVASARVAYVLKRYPRLSETFIVNEVRALERLGAQLELFSLLPPELPPHHSAVDDVTAPLHSLPDRWWRRWGALARSHLSATVFSPIRYGLALWHAFLWSISELAPIYVWTQFMRAGFVATTCQRAKVRHIHAHFANAPAEVAHFASLMSGIPFSLTAHAKDLYLTPKRVLRRHVEAAEFIATCTGYNARYLRTIIGPRSRHKIQLVYHGIDLSTFTDVRTYESADSQPPYFLLSVGRLVPKKGHDDLIVACGMLRDAQHDFRCMIVGAGPEQQALQKLIDRLDLGSRVTLAGPMTHSKLITLYRQADLFALAPRIAENGDRDGIPNVIAEAMATGVPVVSTNISGIPELVRDRQTGLLVAPGDPRALASVIARLLLDPERSARLARAARSVMEQEFDLWTTTTRLHSLLGCEASHPEASANAPGAQVALATE
jgi:glycosyltransferase involved in cell wall biosynthesis